MGHAGPTEPPGVSPTPGLRRRGEHWVWVGGPVPPGSDAITIGRLISVRARAADSAHLLRHEEEHVRQWRELGVLGFLRAYVGAYLRWRLWGLGHQAAYRMIPLEVRAERAADAPIPEGTAEDILAT